MHLCVYNFLFVKMLLDPALVGLKADLVKALGTLLSKICISNALTRCVELNSGGRERRAIFSLVYNVLF